MKLTPNGYVICFNPKKQKGPKTLDQFLIPKTAEVEFRIFSSYVEAINLEISPESKDFFWYRGDEAKKGKRSKFVKSVIHFSILNF